MAIATCSTQGRLTIPVAIRRKYGIKPGSRVEIEQKGNVIRMRPASKDSK